MKAVRGFLWAGLALGVGPLACAGEDMQGPVVGDGGATSQGSTTTTTVTSGQTSTASGGEPECPYNGPPPLDVSTLPACPNCAGGAHCIPGTLVPAEFAGQLGDCDADNKCVPDEFIETQGLLIPESCTSLAGAEGRCLSQCIPQVAEQAAMLPQDVCGEFDVCVPCYDPLEGTATGACELSCDPGPTQPPVTLPKCCGGIGTCVPATAAGENADKLGEDSCPQDNGALLCAPDVFVNDPNWSPSPCTTSLISSFFGSEFGPGACLPECLPDVDNFMIQQDDCQDGFKCAPCLEPPFGQPSGACEL